MKVFMIGAGDIARHHGRAVVRLGGEVIGVYDVSERNLEIYRNEFGCPSCAYEEIEDYVVKADYVVTILKLSKIILVFLMKVP